MELVGEKDTTFDFMFEFTPTVCSSEVSLSGGKIELVSRVE